VRPLKMGRPAHSLDFDLLVLGGGPAGATAARLLAQAGRRVAVLEKEAFPRFHVGESFLPRSLEQLHDLGLAERVLALPHVRKLGAEFALGDGGRSIDFRFSTGLGEFSDEAFNIERSRFDALLLDAARESGAEVHEEARVDEILRLEDGDVAVRSGSRIFTARYLLDASGGATLVGRHLGTRRVHPTLRKVAYFGHFSDVERREGIEGGYPCVVMCADAWFWLIPIDEARTSIGLVMDESDARRVDKPARQMLAWGIRACPELARRCRNAVFPESNGVTADFSYSCRPYAGAGYFLLGDAATFIDPIFSTGVCLGMIGAEQLARDLPRLLRGELTPRRARRRHIHRLRTSTAAFFDLVELYYRPAFRDLFLEGSGPFSVHRAVISVLAGQVFPRPRFALRWRLALFRLIVRLQQRLPLVPREPTFSLLESAEQPATRD